MRDIDNLTEYEEGYIAAVKDLAVWKDGKRYVGVCQQPLDKYIDWWLKTYLRCGEEEL